MKHKLRTYLLAGLSMGLALRGNGQDTPQQNTNPVQEGIWRNSQNLKGAYEWQRKADGSGHHFAATYINDDGKKTYPLHVDVTDKGKLQKAISTDPKAAIEAIIKDGEIFGHRITFIPNEANEIAKKALGKSYQAEVVMYLNKQGEALKDANGHNPGAEIHIINTLDSSKIILDPTLSAEHSDLGEINSKIKNLPQKWQNKFAELFKTVRQYTFNPESKQDITKRIADLKAFVKTIVGTTSPTNTYVQQNKTDITATTPPDATTHTAQYIVEGDRILDTRVPNGQEPVEVGQVVKSASGQVLGIRVQDPKTGTVLTQQIKQGKVVNSSLLMSWANLAEATEQEAIIVNQSAKIDAIVKKYEPNNLNGVELVQGKDGKFVPQNIIIGNQIINMSIDMANVQSKLSGLNPTSTFIRAIGYGKKGTTAEKISNSLELQVGQIGDAVGALAMGVVDGKSVPYNIENLAAIAAIALPTQLKPNTPNTNVTPK